MSAGRTPERRDGLRVAGPFRLDVDDAAFGSVLRVRDLSHSGVSFHTTEPMREMTRVKLMLWLPEDAGSGAEAQFPCEGVVVRAARRAGGNPGGARDYEVAVFFTDLPAPTGTALAGYVAAQQGSTDPSA